jgi:type IV secretory pathway TrbF-like protein
MKRSPAMTHGVQAAAHAVRSGDSHGGGSSVNLSESDRSCSSNDPPPITANARTRDALSARRAGLGRAHRLGPRAGQELALMAFGSLILSAGFAAALVWQSARGTVVPWVVQVDRLGQAQAVAPADADYRRPIRRSPSIWRASSSRSARSRPTRSSCARTGCAPMSSPPIAARMALNDYARANDPFTKVGKQQIAVEVSSVIRASPDSFRVAWTERRYENGQLAGTERWTAILTIVDPAAARRRAAARQSARHLRQCHQLVAGDEPMTISSRNSAFRLSVNPPSRLCCFRHHAGGCATNKPPQISYDADVPPLPAVPPPSPMTGRPLHTPPAWTVARGGTAAGTPTGRVENANAAARVEPRREGYYNAIQIYPWSRRRALSGLCRTGPDHQHRAGAGRKPDRRGTDRGRRHRPLDHRRYRSGSGVAPRPYPRQADRDPTSPPISS